MMADQEMVMLFVLRNQCFLNVAWMCSEIDVKRLVCIISYIQCNFDVVDTLKQI